MLDDLLSWFIECLQCPCAGAWKTCKPCPWASSPVSERRAQSWETLLVAQQSLFWDPLKGSVISEPAYARKPTHPKHRDGHKLGLGSGSFGLRVSDGYKPQLNSQKVLLGRRQGRSDAAMLSNLNPTQRLLCSAFLGSVTGFLVRDYNIQPKKEL